LELRPNPDVVWRRLQGDVVLVHLKTNRIYSLNPTGARFWELLGEGRERDEVEQEMLAEFDVDAAELRCEVDDLVHELSREGLLF
jgi:hypothetical protein